MIGPAEEGMPPGEHGAAPHETGPAWTAMSSAEEYEARMADTEMVAGMA